MYAVRLILLLFFVSPVNAAASEFQPYFTDVCARWNVPDRLALAIAKHESRMNPWAVNVAGQGFMLKSKSEAVRVANYAQAKGLSFDVGLMQVNSRWLRDLKIAPEAAIDPKTNITLGVWILAQEIQRWGLTWKAVASYHTPRTERGKRYFLAVLEQLR